MSAVKPKPRSAGHFYATGNHLIDAANQLFLATVNQDVDKVDVDKVDVDKEEVSLRCQFAVIDLTPPLTNTQRSVR